MDLTRSDPAANLHRYYRMEIVPGLFGDWGLVREWGRIGRAGQMRIDWYATEAAAKDARVALHMAKAKRGYAGSGGRGRAPAKDTRRSEGDDGPVVPMHREG